MDEELRDWLVSLAAPPQQASPTERPEPLSEEGADYLARIATDGTLSAALDEIAATEPELAN